MTRSISGRRVHPSIPIVLTLGILSSGCATLRGGGLLGTSRRVSAPDSGNPIGRWDAVMALRCGSVVRVATKDGFLHTGQYVGAEVHELLIETSVKVQVARADILQIDLLKDPQERSVKSTLLRGAAAGALALGAYEASLGLLFAGKAHMPALRTWTLGAAWGAVSGAVGWAPSRPRTIYISP